MKTARLLPDGRAVTVLADGTTVPLDSQTDWAQVKAMTEADIEANALSDPDNLPLSDEELQRFEPVPNLKKIRQELQLSQSQFAQKFHLSLRTVQDWEQGRSQPDQAAQTLLKVIAHNPNAVSEALNPMTGV